MDNSVPPRVGQGIPGFRLEAYCPERKRYCEVALEDLLNQGKWFILFFYPADFSVVCPTELAELAAIHAPLRELGCTVIAVSGDSVHTHLGWLRQESLLEQVGFPMASDIRGRLAEALGILDEHTGLPLRATILVNPDGVIMDMEIAYFNVGRNVRELLRKVAAYMHITANPKEACPAGWQPGDTALTPDEELVGRVETVWQAKKDVTDQGDDQD